MDRIEHVDVEGKCERCTIRRHLMEYSIRKVLRGLMTKNSAIEEMRPGIVEMSCLTVIEIATADEGGPRPKNWGHPPIGTSYGQCSRGFWHEIYQRQAT